jgi:hypothetical protein
VRSETIGFASNPYASHPGGKLLCGEEYSFDTVAICTRRRVGPRYQGYKERQEAQQSVCFLAAFKGVQATRRPLGVVVHLYVVRTALPPTPEFVIVLSTEHGKGFNTVSRKLSR